MSRDHDTGTSRKPRKGIGTIRRFRASTTEPTFVVIEREGGGRVMLTLAPELSDRLLREYGFQETERFTSVAPLIGMRVRYEESATGMLTDLQPLRN